MALALILFVAVVVHGMTEDEKREIMERCDENPDGSKKWMDPTVPGFAAICAKWAMCVKPDAGKKDICDGYGLRYEHARYGVTVQWPQVKAYCCVPLDAPPGDYDNPGPVPKMVVSKTVKGNPPGVQYAGTAPGSGGDTSRKQPAQIQAKTGPAANTRSSGASQSSASSSLQRAPISAPKKWELPPGPLAQGHTCYYWINFTPRTSRDPRKPSCTDVVRHKPDLSKANVMVGEDPSSFDRLCCSNIDGMTCEDMVSQLGKRCCRPDQVPCPLKYHDSPVVYDPKTRAKGKAKYLPDSFKDACCDLMGTIDWNTCGHWQYQKDETCKGRRLVDKKKMSVSTTRDRYNEDCCKEEERKRCFVWFEEGYDCRTKGGENVKHTAASNRANENQVYLPGDGASAQGCCIYPKKNVGFSLD